MKALIGKKVEIISDNDHYSEWIGRTLEITEASIGGRFYDSSMYPECLCDLKDAETGEDCPFALYEYEFKLK